MRVRQGEHERSPIGEAHLRCRHRRVAAAGAARDARPAKHLRHGRHVRLPRALRPRVQSSHRSDRLSLRHDLHHLRRHDRAPGRVPASSSDHARTLCGELRGADRARPHSGCGPRRGLWLVVRCRAHLVSRFAPDQGVEPRRALRALPQSAPYFRHDCHPHHDSDRERRTPELDRDAGNAGFPPGESRRGLCRARRLRRGDDLGRAPAPRRGAHRADRRHFVLCVLPSGIACRRGQRADPRHTGHLSFRLPSARGFRAGVSLDAGAGEHGLDGALSNRCRLGRPGFTARALLRGRVCDGDRRRARGTGGRVLDHHLPRQCRSVAVHARGVALCDAGRRGSPHRARRLRQVRHAARDRTAPGALRAAGLAALVGLGGLLLAPETLEAMPLIARIVLSQPIISGGIVLVVTYALLCRETAANQE